MRPEFKKITDLLFLFFNITARQSDHKKLAQHIINVNQQDTPAGIINALSLCLKDILGYRLFAFVIKLDQTLDVWLDPRMYKKSLESVIMDDFQVLDNSKINYLNHDFQGDEKELEFSLNSLTSFNLSDCLHESKLYIMPNSNAPAHHDEMVQMLLKSAGIALSKQLNIDRLVNAASIDPLTECYNRREFQNHINQHIATAKRYGSNLSIFMFDIDHFKKINDTFGHQIGDDVLKITAKLVKDNIRNADILARYGGEEFIAILPGTDKVEAIELAERLRLKIAGNTIETKNSPINITASFGIAQFDGVSDMTSLLQEADEMMYLAKNSGRNQVMPKANQISMLSSRLK